MKKVPGNVLHHSSVASEDGLGIDNLSLLGHSTDVPQTDSLKKTVRRDKKNNKK